MRYTKGMKGWVATGDGHCGNGSIYTSISITYPGQLHCFEVECFEVECSFKT